MTQSAWDVIGPQVREMTVACKALPLSDTDECEKDAEAENLDEDVEADCEEDSNEEDREEDDKEIGQPEPAYWQMVAISLGISM